MIDQPNSGSEQNDAPSATEQDAFRKFILATEGPPARSTDRLLETVQQIEQESGVRGPSWSLLKETLPHYTEWPHARLIALVERIEMGERPDDAGFSELLNAND